MSIIVSGNALPALVLKGGVTIGAPTLLAPTNTALPIISGTPDVGNTLTVSTGTWDGTTPISYAYQWRLEGVNISGATASTYVVAANDQQANISCVVTATNELGSASSTAASVAIPLAPYEGVVATRGMLGAVQILPSFPEAQIKTGHHARDDISSLKLLFADIRGTGEAGSGAVTTISAAIEYNGVRTRVPFGGVNDGAIPSGGTLLSDEVVLPATIPDGALFHIHQFKRNPNGYIYTDSREFQPAMGDKVHLAASGLTDIVMSADPVSNAGNHHAPAVIGMTKKASVLVLGDSKCMGAVDASGGNAAGNSGEIERSIGLTYGFVNAGVDGGHSYNTHTVRETIAQYASHVVANYGINEIRGGYTFDAVKLSYAKLWAGMRGLGGQIVPDGPSVILNSGLFWGNAETVTEDDTMLSAYVHLNEPGDFKLVVVNASNVVTFDQNYSGVKGVNKVALNTPVTTGSRLFYQYTSGTGGLVYTTGGSASYFTATSYSGSVGDSVEPVSDVQLFSLAFECGYHVRRKAVHATIAPSEVSGSPEASNGVRVSTNNFLRSTPLMLNGFADLANVVEEPNDSGIWVPAFTTDLIHENATGYQAIQDANIFPALTYTWR